MTDHAKTPPRILCVDDTPANLDVLNGILSDYKRVVALNGERALKIANSETRPDLILLDIMMPEMDGFEVCRRLKANEYTREIPVIFLSAKSETEDIIKGFGLGAVDYVAKPFNPTELLARVHSHVTLRRLRIELERQNEILQHELKVAEKLFKDASERSDGPLIGDSDAIRAVRRRIVELAKSDDVILLTGPPGAGDEAVARAIHRASPRRERAFIHTNCAQLRTAENTRIFAPDFPKAGRGDGAETDLFYLADTGTLYLDAVHDLPVALQRQLADAIMAMSAGRSAADSSIRDVRLVVHSSKDLAQAVAAGAFASALYDRIRPCELRIPPLAERLDDIPALADFLISQYARRIGKAVNGVSQESIARMRQYAWPGNIRELQNVLERATVTTTDGVVEIGENLLSPGIRLDRYILTEKLGVGGMGEVWRATHHLLARPVAVKLIRTGKSGNEAAAKKALRKFEREAQTTAQLQSPHTIKLYDFGVAETGELYFVMELLEGMDLDAMVTQFGPIVPERVVYLIRQACRSLIEAHQAGLIHRDIKPQNLFVCKLGPEYDFLKILDFGIVKERNTRSRNVKATTTDEITGTPSTVAPELLSGETIDPRTDLYSLGCTMYWMLTGKYVFDASSVMEMLMHHMHTEPKPPSTHCNGTIPAALDHVVMACLAKRPEDRPPSAAELWQRLDDLPFANPWSLKQAQRWWSEVARADTKNDSAPAAPPITKSLRIFDKTRISG